MERKATGGGFVNFKGISVSFCDFYVNLKLTFGLVNIYWTNACSYAIRGVALVASAAGVSVINGEERKQQGEKRERKGIGVCLVPSTSTCRDLFVV